MKTLSLLGAALLVSAASAQTTTPAVTGETLTAIQSDVSLNTAKDSDTVKKGTKFTRYLRSSAGVRGGHVHNSASIGKSYDWRKRQSYYYASLSTSGRLYGMDAKDKGAASVNDGGSTPAQYQVAYKFDLPKTVKGKFYVSLGGMASKNGKVAMTAAVGKNKPVTWSSGNKPATGEFSYDFASGAVVVQLWAEGSASLTGKVREMFSGRGMVTFKPEAAPPVTCTVTPGKANCGGDLAGKVATSSSYGNTVNCTLTKAAKNAIGIVLLSPDGKMATVGKCDFFSNVTGLMGIIRTDKDGMAMHKLRMPLNKKLTVYVQDVILEFGQNGLVATASNDLKIECK